MCGIAGIFAYAADSLDGISGEVATIRDAMAPRGPDGTGEWLSSDRRAALGHRRLAIIDLREEASQPMTSPEHRLTIVFNGEIYNYRALRRDLASKGYRFRTESDTEVLLLLYVEYGLGMCERLRGMYAFGICDERDGSLLLARDPFGIKPLYISDDGGVLRFASQVKALLAGGRVDTRPDAAGHVGFYLWGSVPEPYTLFERIRSLEPGTALLVDRNGRRNIRPFCSIPAILREASVDPARSEHPAERLGRLHSLLLDSVRHHLVADVPVGVFLSAGIDSQSIAALVRESGHGDLRTVTMGFAEYRGTTRDEVPLAELCAARNNAMHTTCMIAAADFEASRVRFLAAMDQPSIDGANTYFVSRAAARLGLKVCLSGVGGDEMFGGYSTFKSMPRLVRVARRLVPASSLGKALRWVSARWIGQFTSPKYAGLFELGRSMEGAYLLHRGLFMPWELPRLLPVEIVRRGWAELAPMARLTQTIAGLGPNRARIAGLEMCWYMRNQLLRDSDWAGMAHSLEIRVPFLDVELLRNLAPGLSAPVPLEKSWVAEACGLQAGERPKTGFSIPIAEWFRPANPASGGISRGLRAWARYTAAETYGPRLALPAS